MAKVEIYTWSHCPYCKKAKALLARKGVNFIEYNMDGDEDARDKMAERTAGPRSVPQIFINDKYIGGCDNLHRLNDDGKLDPLLVEDGHDPDNGMSPA